MNPTGRLEDGTTLVLERRFTAPIDDVWASITESDRLARWFGTWSGDPSSGWVMVTMTAEAEPMAPIRYDIRACEPPRRLSVSATDEYGTWILSAELAHDDQGTTLVLRQHDVDPATLAGTGPGWEWYLDRLAGAMDGSTLPSLDDFDRTYLPMGTHYEGLAG